MLESLQNRCELFLKNRGIMKSGFKLDYPIMHYLCSLLYTSCNAQIDIERIKACKKLIRENTSWLSNFRGIANLAVAAQLAQYDDPQTMMYKAIRAYDILKQSGFSASDYLVIASMMLAAYADEQSYPQTAEKAMEIFKLMKKHHPFITAREDHGFAVLMAMNSMEPEAVMEEAERCYDTLKARFTYANAVQSLSHILALGSTPSHDKCQKVFELFDIIKDRGCKYGTGLELPSLGIVALIDTPVETLGDNIAQVNEFLLTHKGRGSLGIGRTQRVMYATALVVQDYLDSNSHLALDMALANNVTSVILASQIAVISAVTSSTAAAAAASN